MSYPNTPKHRNIKLGVSKGGDSVEQTFWAKRSIGDFERKTENFREKKRI